MDIHMYIHSILSFLFGNSSFFVFDSLMSMTVSPT
jgi:hypothetical protein